MRETDADAAKALRERSRAQAARAAAADKASGRAARPSIENMAGNPDELRIGLGAAPAGANLVYAVVDLDDKDAAPGWKPYEGPVSICAEIN